MRKSRFGSAAVVADGTVTLLHLGGIVRYSFTSCFIWEFVSLTSESQIPDVKSLFRLLRVARPPPKSGTKCPSILMMEQKRRVEQHQPEILTGGFLAPFF